MREKEQIKETSYVELMNEYSERHKNDKDNKGLNSEKVITSILLIGSIFFGLFLSLYGGLILFGPFGSKWGAFTIIVFGILCIYIGNLLFGGSSNEHEILDVKNIEQMKETSYVELMNEYEANINKNGVKNTDEKIEY